MINETAIQTANSILLQKARIKSGTHPAPYSMSTSFFFLQGIRRSGLEFDLSPSSAEVKSEWSRTSYPPLCLQCVYRDEFLPSFVHCFDKELGTEKYCKRLTYVL